MGKKRKVDFNLASEVFEDASLSDTFKQQYNNNKTLIKIDLLKENPYQPRIQMEQDHIIELANSIKENGLLQPITAIENGSGSYTIVFGHRRVAAYEYLGKEKIESIIIDNIDDKNLIIAPLVENMQRKDMEPIETAIALDKIIKMGIVKTQDELSKSIGLSQGRISKLLSVLKLSDNVLKEVKLTKYKDATVLAALNKINLSDQREVFDNIKILKREDALKEIKTFFTKKTVDIKRVHYANNIIKINTKNISKETKELLAEHLSAIENILSNE